MTNIKKQTPPLSTGWGDWLSLPHLTMLDARPPELVDAAAHAGFHSISLRLIPTMKGEAQHPMLDKSPMQREVRAALDATGVTVCDIEAIWLHADSDARQYQREFEAAAELGARCVQVIGNDPDVDRLAETFARFCDMGQGFGLSMALEFMRISALRNLQAAQHVLRTANRPNGVLSLDALHWFRCDTPLDDLRRLDPARIGMIQICDAPLQAPIGHDAMVHEARFHRALPGEGELPLVDWLKCLPRDKALAIEAPIRAAGNPPAPARARATHLMQGLKRFLERERAGLCD